MFWKKKRRTFMVGDVLKFKEGLTHGRIKGLPLGNWRGRVIELMEGGVKLELDATTLHEMSDELIESFIAEGRYPHIQSIGYQYVEFSKPRDTQADIRHAQDAIIERVDTAKGIARQLIEYNKWSRHFLASDTLAALGETEKEYAEFVLSNFYDCMKKYEKKVPTNWTENALKKVLTKWMPSRVWGTSEMFGAYVNVIIAFFDFLQEKGFRNTEKLRPIVLESKDTMIYESQKSGNWTEDKKALMEAVSAGVDMSDKGAVSTFLSERRLEGLKETIEELKESGQRLKDAFRQPDHPPIDPFIKEQSDDPFIHLKRNQKITVQYTDGIIKENVKFKDVKKDLYEGLCELIN